MVVVTTCSSQLSRDISHGWHHVDAATGNDHSGLALECAGNGRVDLLGGNGVDCLAVLPEGQGTVRLVVAGNFLKTVSGALHSEHEAHLKVVLGSDEFSLIKRSSKSVELLNGDLEEISGVGTSTVDVDTKETSVAKVRVDAGDGIDESVINNSLMGAAGVRFAESVGGTHDLLNELEDWDISMAPWDGLEGNLDAGQGGLGPGSVFSTDVLGCLALVVVLGNGKDVTKTLFDEFDVFGVVLDTGGGDNALLGGNVVHNELLEAAGIKITNVANHSEAGHTEGVVAECGSKEEFLVFSGGVELAQVVVEVVGLSVLRLGNVGSED